MKGRVVVVTGGGAGIGAAVAEEIGRAGAHVVTVDPLVSTDGTERLPDPEQTTAGRIVAAGGSAEASNASVTDAAAVRDLFARLVAEHGALDAVVNVAGISRPSGFAAGTEDVWSSVLEVHLDGYLNVLAAALPLMAEAGRGHIVGVTSGSGWRAANAGAYSCAKRAVAALTWQLGPVVPPGVVLNTMSPIAVTRMVTGALERARAAGGGGATGGISLGSMPEPEELGPFAAHLVGAGFTWAQGRVFFAGGSEVAHVDPPRLLEVVRTTPAASLAAVLDAVVPSAWAAAEANQASAGGANPRFAGVFDSDAGVRPPLACRAALVVGDGPEVVAALEARGITCTTAPAGDGSFASATAALRDTSVDAVVVALGGGGVASAAGGWDAVLAEHGGLVAQIRADAGWARAVADLGRPVRLVTLTDASTTGGRSRAQAAAQLARSSRGATSDRVSAFSIAVEHDGGEAAAELAAHLVAHPDAPALAGAELVAGAGWAGLRSHPRPSGTLVVGGGALPAWFDGALRAVVGV